MSAAWPTPAVAEFAKTSAGGTPKKSNADFYDGGTIPWLLSGEVGVRDISSAANFITEAGLKGSSAKLFPPHSVLVAMYGATAGEVGILRFEAATNQAVCAILPGKRHVPEYLYYYLLLARPLLVSQAIGNAQPNISQAKIKALEIPLPPLEEQKRIVAVLDQAFAALDRARTNAEANLAYAEELRAQAVQGALQSLGEPEPIGPHVDLLSGFAFKSKGYSDNDEDIRLIRGDNIVQGKFRWNGVKRWPMAEREQYKRYELALDDVLIAMDRTWVSAGIKFSVVDEEALPCLLVQRVARLRTKPSILPRFLAYCIGSKLFERYVLDIQTGLGVPHVSGKQIEAFEIPVPDLPTQQGLVDRLDAIHEKAGRLLVNAEAVLSDLDDLRQSILQKAFVGELTNPDFECLPS